MACTHYCRTTGFPRGHTSKGARWCPTCECYFLSKQPRCLCCDTILEFKART